MNFLPVTLQFANVFGSNPQALPIPGDNSVLGVNAPKWADDNTIYLMPDGSLWEYKGISAYKCDNDMRVNGWLNITAFVKA